MKWTGKFKVSKNYIDFRNLDYVTEEWLMDLVENFNVHTYPGLDVTSDTMDIYQQVWGGTDGIYFRVKGSPAQSMVMSTPVLNHFLIKGIQIDKS